MARRPKELTPEESYRKVKELIKEKKRLTKKDLIPGNILFTFYDAKDKTQTYDRTPLVLILRRNSTHTLGLNFHWLPINMRLDLVLKIIKLNKRNIREGKPIQFSYKQLKPMLKRLGYAPCIRLYINSRFAKNGVIIPPARLMELALMKTETFTNGRYSASQMFRMAQQAGKDRARRRKNTQERERYARNKDKILVRRRELRQQKKRK